MTRVLVLSADVGESHMQMARIVADDLGSRADVEDVTVLGDLSPLGARLGGGLARGFRFHLGEVGWSYDLAYRTFTGLAPARRAGERALFRLGGAQLERTIAAHRPDVVVSTYPVMNPVLAGLRRTGRMASAAVAIVDPVGGHEFWVQPDLDLHLTTHPEAVPAVKRLAGGAPVRPARPLVRPEFFAPGSRGQSRVELGIPAGEPLVLISGGGWGAGDLGGAVQACLTIPHARVVAVCGRNDALRDELGARHRAEPRVSVRGFTERMHDLLWAADAFVTATAGSSCAEARLCGCPTVTYGFTVGHVRDNTRALAAHGLARRATTLAGLRRAVEEALESPRPPIPPLAQLPSAAELIIELVRGASVSEANHRAASASAAAARPGS